MDDEKKDIGCTLCFLIFIKFRFLEMKDDAAIKFSNVKVSEGTLQQQLESVRSGRCDKLAWRGAEVREHFRMLFKNDGKFLLKIFPMLSDCVDYSAAASGCPLDGLFCEAIIVPPKKFRPIRMFKGQQYEDPQTVNLRRVLEASETLKAIVLVMRGENSAVLNELIATRTSGKTLSAKMHDAYIALQTNVNGIFDEELCKNNKDHIAGIKQILEKKQGLFRMNMMGKRVNYACRSVITPDPYLDIDEIGIPDIFARKLTFTEPVNVFNLQRLRQFVRNGPKNHPGANYVQLPNGKKQVLGDLSEDEKKRRVGLARQLAPADKEQLRYPYMVMRHLLNGDMLVMNRQPSLHKPSMLGHRARVLFGQRALRMNYAPCKAYNADFDGDEMNGHLVQSYQGQTEVREIVNVGSNLLVPKDATPLLGLIQDHVVSGVLLTLRSRFLNKEDFMHLILAAFGYHSSRIDLPPPTIWKPVKLWTGKQVISCIIKNCIPDGKPLINLDGKAKTPLSCWKMPGHNPPDFDMSESHVVFREGELLVGVFDKSHFGATQYGLIHCIFELYGHRVGVKVLSCFSRLFTTYLQLHGFTLGVADILVKKEANEKRKVAVLQSRTIGNEVVCNAFGLPADTPEEELRRVLASAYNNPRGDQINVKMLDFAMKQGISKYNDTINKSCVPEGLIRLFPQNALQMMIQSGAKGSAVNAIQISCALGQIELEGKRMAVTIAGRTLPSFPAFDSSPRAGGFIDQRFLTGINPQELFFHTMAGREGLIDTAVKTSRSGYLQRCIIKHLEGIKVHYDSTVRDHDGSVIQFRYGEDALDVCKSSFMNPKAIGVLCDNLTALEMSCKPEGANDRDFGVEDTEKHYKKIRKYRRKSLKKGMTAKKIYKSVFTEFADEHEGFDKEHLVKMWQELTLEERKEYKQRSYKPPPRPVDEKFNITSTLGALSEKTLDIINEAAGNDDDKLKRALMWKGMACLAEPGENVGLLAAQSIGEPSTQMTLNTFHFAGRGEMNVTLGIPRLREILMTQSKAIATPSAQIAVLSGTPRERIDAIKRELDRVYMKQVMKSYVLEEKINMSKNENWRRYVLRINILEPKRREVSARHLKNSSVIKTLEGRFIRNVSLAISKKYHEVVQYQQLQHRKLRSGNIAALSEIQKNIDKSVGLMGPDDGQSSDEEADGGREADAAEKRLHQRHLDEADYDGEEDERNQVQGEEEPEAEDVDKDDEKEMGNEEDGDEQAEGDGSPHKPIQINGNDSAQLDYDNRVKYVLGLSDMITAYNFDRKKSSWCEIVFQLQLRNKSKLDLATIVEREIEHFIVHQTHGIERCIEREETRDGQTVIFLQTQGINLDAFFRHSDVLDVNSVYSNDLNLVLNQYGIEACNRAIVSIDDTSDKMIMLKVSAKFLPTS
ncbi:hypothetical protein WR25_01740 isoform C [Diploscapter pachys]|nr:hypothetical protein WR25_01740 isoform C [Diploscapter pachys]